MKEVILRGMTFGDKNSYGLYQYMRREQYNVNEGDVVTLMHRGSDDEKGKIVRVKVISVDFHHITVEFPAGYRKSLNWIQFDKERQ